MIEPSAASNLVPVPTDVVMISLTAVLAVLALVAAAVAVRAARRTARAKSPEAASPAPAVAPERRPRAAVLVPVRDDSDDVSDAPWSAPQSVEGRVIVPPTGQQVVGAAMSRPHVRLAILLHGLTYALRAESRDRITARPRIQRLPGSGERSSLMPLDVKEHEIWPAVTPGLRRPNNWIPTP